MKTKKIFNLICVSILLLTTLFPLPVKAQIDNTVLQVDTELIPEVSNQSQMRSIETSDVAGKEFFIKNMYTGQYLDVAGGVSGNGVNVQQYKFNGSDAQRWYFHDNQDGTFSIYSRLSDDNYYRYALDISNGSTADCANVQIWSITDTDAQKFQISRTAEYSSFVFFTKVTNYSKAIVLNGPTCDQGRNVDQYTFQYHVNEMWILEPVSLKMKFGIEYAKTNYNHTVAAYPNTSGIGGNCANFTSQCLLSSGLHYTSDWYVYRKNDNYWAPTSVSQLDNSWELADPSPWISAKEFGKFWQARSNYHCLKGKDIVEDPTLMLKLAVHTGDAVQIADNILGIKGNSTHTMFISGVTNTDLLVTYQSDNTLQRSLIDICEDHPNDYFVFYEIPY